MNFVEELTKLLDRELSLFRFAAIVNVKGNSYYVDCCDTMDHGIELMVFKMNIKAEEKISKNYESRDWSFTAPKFVEADWDALYENRFDTIEDAEKDFDYVVANLEELLDERD